MKTYAPKPRDIERRWYVLDADGQVLGRLASEAAAILRGKHKPIFAPHMDTGDHVIVVNAKGIELTGSKRETKVAYRHSGYPGGLTETKYSRLLAEKPAFAVEKAIRGMLPKNRLGRAMSKKLHVYAGPTHRHEAQQPKPLRLGEVPPWEGLPAPRVRPPAPREDPPAGAKAPAKRSPAETTTTKRSPAETTTAKRSPAKTTTAKRAATPGASAAKKSTAKRSSTSSAEKSTAKRSTARRSKKKED